MNQKINKLMEEEAENVYTCQLSSKRREKILKDHVAVLKVPFDTFKAEPIPRIKQLELEIEGQKKAYFEGISNGKKALKGSEATLGLSINKQVRQNTEKRPYSYVRIRSTGQTFFVDPVKARQSRLKKRCENHFKVINEFDTVGTPYSSFDLDESPNFKHQFYTLTYDPKKGDWSESDISEFFDRFRRYIERKVCPNINDPWLYLAYFWVREFHKSGRVHYHFILTSPKSWDLPNIHLDRKNIWVKGMTTCGMRDKKPIRSFGYLMKYLTKDDSKSSESPKYRSQRAYGASYIKKLVHLDSTFVESYTRIIHLPKWMRQKLNATYVGFPTDSGSFSYDDMDRQFRVSRVSGGYIVNRVYYESPYSFESLENLKEDELPKARSVEDSVKMHRGALKPCFDKLVFWE